MVQLWTSWWAVVTFDVTTCSASKWKGRQAYDVKVESCFKAQSPLFKLTFKPNTCNFKLLSLLRMGNTISKTLDENIASIIGPFITDRVWCNRRFLNCLGIVFPCDSWCWQHSSFASFNQNCCKTSQVLPLFKLPHNLVKTNEKRQTHLLLSKLSHTGQPYTLKPISAWIFERFLVTNSSVLNTLKELTHVAWK